MAPFRPYDRDTDWEAAKRIWREVGWFDDSKEMELGFRVYADAGGGMVADLNGEAECLVLTMPATLRYLEEDLPLCAVTGVTTSHVARKQGLASHLTAHTVALEAANGALAAALGVFEQGYYDRFGFGTGCYDHVLTFDPVRIKVDLQHRVPVRITRDDWVQVHQALLNRQRRHGAMSLRPPAFAQAEMLWTKKPWGLGYRDGPGGALSHLLWGERGGSEHGPYRVYWLIYRNRAEFLELMALLKSLGDQVHAVSIREPSGIQLQDLVEQPFKQGRITERSDFHARSWSACWWQLRILDLGGCLARTRLDGGPLRFNLALSDPIARYLDDDAPWRGLGGDYVVTLGDPSSAEPGHDAQLLTLRTTVNAFSRLWLGVRPATTLTYSDRLDGPPELLAALDRILRLPAPVRDWEF